MPSSQATWSSVTPQPKDMTLHALEITIHALDMTIHALDMTIHALDITLHALDMTIHSLKLYWKLNLPFRISPWPARTVHDHHPQPDSKFQKE